MAFLTSPNVVNEPERQAVNANAFHPLVVWTTRIESVYAKSCIVNVVCASVCLWPFELGRQPQAVYTPITSDITSVQATTDKGLSR